MPDEEKTLMTITLNGAEMPPVVSFASAAALRDSCAGQEITPAHRATLANALRDKRDSMANIAPANAQALTSAAQEIERGTHDVALAVMLASNVPLDFPLRKIRGARDNVKDTFNVYSVPKLLHVAPKMLSDMPIYGNVGVAATLRGTILGILAGAHDNPKTSLSVFLDDYMNSLPIERKRPYSSGGTQSSSSAHALASLGLLAIPAPGKYSVPSAAALEALKRLAGASE
jgi:hypothetical protein